MPIKVFNADDHPMLRRGISQLIKEDPDMDFVGSAEDGTGALEKIRGLKPDIAILDIEMPGMSGIDVARTLLAEGTSTSFIIMTLFKDDAFLKNALSVGIRGYLLKEANGKEVIECIKQVYRGGMYVSGSMTHILFSDAQERNELDEILSKHEINILKLIASGKTTAEIADMLFISPKTVANHRNNISKKLQLTGTQNGLLMWAIEHKDVLFNM